MAKYELTGGLTHDGKEYQAGETVELTAEQAEKLAPILKPSKGSKASDAAQPTGGTEPTAPSAPSYSKLTKAQLIAELEARGLEADPNDTNKALVERLEASDASQPSGGTEPTE